MPETLKLKLTVYQPEIMVDGQAGFEYDLDITIPEIHAKGKGTGKHAEASAARCDVVPVTGTLSFPNPAAPVFSPFTGLLFIYDNAPIIGFPLTIIANSTEATLPFNLTLAFPASPVDYYAGAIKFGTWPGPMSDTTASFLSPQVAVPGF